MEPNSSYLGSSDLTAESLSSTAGADLPDEPNRARVHGPWLEVAVSAEQAEEHRKHLDAFFGDGADSLAGPLTNAQVLELATSSGLGFFGQWQLWQGNTADLLRFARALTSGAPLKDSPPSGA
jgi:hypothetical protein